MQQIPHKFNIRVYALIFNNKSEILLSDEYMLDQYMTKFPGGGLEFGEGAKDCIKREIMEELGIKTDIIEHFYTTDFFQKALFFKNTQLISIYYKVILNPSAIVPTTDKALDIPKVNGSQSFRWMKIDQIKETDLSFPIDRHVLNLLKQS